MCEPLTLALMAGGGQFLSTSAGIADQKKQVQQQVLFNVAAIERQYDKVKGQQNTAAAVSGVETSGSIEDVMVRTEGDREFDKLTEVYKGDVKLAELKRQQFQAVFDSAVTAASVYGSLGGGAAKTPAPIIDKSPGLLK